MLRHTVSLLSFNMTFTVSIIIAQEGFGCNYTGGIILQKENLATPKSVHADLFTPEAIRGTVLLSGQHTPHAERSALGTTSETGYAPMP